MTPPATTPRTHWIEPVPGVRLWVEEHGDPDAPALLLVMGAASSGLAWPDPLVHGLALRHRVIRYDHRDTGRSTWSYAEQPYAVSDLAGDAVAVLDALGVERAHAVGMSLGGILVQLLVTDHPDRLLSATVFGTCAASEAPWTRADGTRATPADLPPVDPRLIEAWSRPPRNGTRQRRSSTGCATGSCSTATRSPSTRRSSATRKSGSSATRATAGPVRPMPRPTSPAWCAPPDWPATRCRSW